MSYIVYKYTIFILCYIEFNIISIFINNKIIYILQKDYTWNHKLLTILLSKNSGNTHIVPNIKDKNGWIHDHTIRAIPGEWPNKTVNEYLTNGKSPYSNTAVLAQNTPPFNAQHWRVLLITIDFLRSYTDK